MSYHSVKNEWDAGEIESRSHINRTKVQNYGITSITSNSKNTVKDYSYFQEEEDEEVSYVINNYAPVAVTRDVFDIDVISFVL